MIMNRTPFKFQLWLTFGNVASLSKDYILTPYEEDATLSSFEALLGECYSTWNSGSAPEKALALKVLQQVYRRFYNHYVFSVPKDFESDEELQADSDFAENKLHFVVALTNIFVQTKDRYMFLLQAYESEKSKLLDGVKTLTTGVGRFNDTPQNITDGDEFGDNTHLSNITKSTAEASSDFDTKMARLDEIARKYRNLLKDWTDEFDSLFIEERNVL